MNKETQKGSDVRNYVKYRKYKTLLYRLFNTVVLLLFTAGAGLLLRKAQGCDCIPLKWGATTRETILAEDEHLRWNAYHRMLGYSRWDLKNPPLEQVRQKKANQLDTFGKHACLVDFAALPDVDYAIACAIDPTAKGRLKPSDFVGNVQVVIDGKQKSSLQAYDYMFVRKIWTNATAAGMKLVKAR